MRLLPLPGDQEWVGEGLRNTRFLLTAWPWRALAHLAQTTVVLLTLCVPVLLVATPVLTGLSAGGTAAPTAGLAASLVLLITLLVLLAPTAARLDLTRLALVDHRPRPSWPEPDAGARSWHRRLTSRSSWLQVLHLMTTLVAGPAFIAVVLGAFAATLVLLAAPLIVGLTGGSVAVGAWQITTSGQAWAALLLSPAALAVSAYLCGGFAAAQVLLARLLLVDPERPVQERLSQVTRTSVRLVDAFDAERRRIERDLHDVAQQRVVALTMQLALAELDLDATLGPGHPAATSVRAAHRHATDLMDELRALVQGIHPKVLTDRGLTAALEHLASTLPLPVLVQDHLGARPPSHVETSLYYCLSEALNNTVRHSSATRATVTLTSNADRILAEVWDDGHGGADPALGSGLAGMADRAAVLDGRVDISSPPAGPTLVRISLPRTPVTAP